MAVCVNAGCQGPGRSKGEAYLFSPEEGPDDPIPRLVDFGRGDDDEAVPLLAFQVPVPLCPPPPRVGSPLCSLPPFSFDLPVAVLFAADEPLDGGEVGQQEVVPADEVLKRWQARVGGRRRGWVVREVLQLRVEERDGVDELDEAESERVEVDWASRQAGEGRSRGPTATMSHRGEGCVHFRCCPCAGCASRESERGVTASRSRATFAPRLRTALHLVRHG